MRKNILLTGMPKSGKSTLLERIVAEQINTIGFLTKEIRENGERTGFEVINYRGEHTPIASTKFNTNIRVSRYFVNIENLDKTVPSVSSFNKNNLLYLDEIGLMQIYSEKFKNLALKYLDSENLCLATIKVYNDEFMNNIRSRKDIILVEINPENREERYQFVTKLIGKIRKAERYLSEPKRFNISSDTVKISTDHGEKNLIKSNDVWSCDCDFYNVHNICSHMLACEEFYKEKSI